MSDYKAYPDEKLLVLIKEHSDHLAYAAVFERYNSLIYSHVYNKLRNQQESEDVVQDIFSQFWIKRKDIDLSYRFPGYLFLLARNKVIDLVRQKKLGLISAGFFADINLSNEPATDFLLREKQFEALIAYEIEQLPPRMREVFTLRRRKHLSIKEISHEMNISEATVKSQMKKALKILRLRLRIAVFLICLAIIPH